LANRTLHDVWPSPELLYTIYIFSGAVAPLTEFCQVQNSLYVQVMPSHIAPVLAALLHVTPAVGVSQTLRRGTKEWNYRTFAEGATYIFGRVAITFGNVPNSVFLYNTLKYADLN